MPAFCFGCVFVAIACTVAFRNLANRVHNQGGFRPKGTAAPLVLPIQARGVPLASYPPLLATPRGMFYVGYSVLLLAPAHSRMSQWPTNTNRGFLWYDFLLSSLLCSLVPQYRFFFASGKTNSRFLVFVNSTAPFARRLKSRN